MTMQEFQADIRKSYPPILSLENVRIILRISKRKASWMLQNGIIKCKIKNKQTRKFQIQIDDLFEYMEKVEKNDPSVKVPCGLFNTKPAKTHRANTIIAPSLIYRKAPRQYRLFLADKWCDYPDLLYAEDVAKITGYSIKTAQKWIAEKKLKSVWSQNDLFTTKEWLIEYYQTSGHKISNMCSTHILLLMEYYQQENSIEEIEGV